MESADIFEDVQSGSWYEDAVSWAVERNIVKGIDNVTFAPYRSVTREEFSTLIYRYAQYLEKDTTVSDRKKLKAFSDYDNVSDWAEDAMAWSVEKNIINGTGVGLEPQKVATRAQTAKMLYYSRYYFSFGRPCNE